MNDLIPGTRVDGHITYRGEDLYDPASAPSRCAGASAWSSSGPTPSPSRSTTTWPSAPRSTACRRRELDEVVETALQQAALWDEVKDKLKKSALALSGGQQQRLCIARAIAVKPDVILMDEPCSALDPIATLRIEELMIELKNDYTIVIVTHNMQQAARVVGPDRLLHLRGRRRRPDGRAGGGGPHRGHLHQPRGQAHRRLHSRPFRRAGPAKNKKAGGWRQWSEARRWGCGLRRLENRRQALDRLFSALA